MTLEVDPFAMLPDMGGLAVRAPIVGRAPELARLGEACARASLGEGIAVLVGGEAGIGKTRLVSEFAHQARAQGIVVLRGDCLEAGAAGLPYGPVAQALNTAVASGVLDPRSLPTAVVEQLAILVPSLADPDAADRGPFELAGLGQVRLFEALLASIERLGTDRAMVLVIEDLHWADRSTLDLVTFLVRNVVATRCLLVATLRTDDVERGGPLADTLAELTRKSNVIRLDLQALEREQTAAYLGHILGTAPARDVVDEIHRRSDGNPFFVEQLAWARQDGEETAVPPSLRDILLNQLSRQPAEVQALLGAASIAGPRMDEGLVAAMLDLPESAVVPALRQAVRAHILVPVRGADGESYPFRHALMAEAVEADLLDGERRRLRTKCADAMEHRPPRDGVDRAQWAARIAHHRDLAGDRRGTVAASLLAAGEAETVAAYRDALVQYRRALAILQAEPDLAAPEGWDRAEIGARAASSAAVAGEPKEAARLLGLALQDLPADVDPWRRGAMLVDLSEFLWLAGDDRFVEALATAAEVVPPEPPTRERADALVALGFHLKYNGDPDGARSAWEAARATAARAEARRTEAMSLCCLSQSATERGAVGVARQLAHEALEVLSLAEASRDTAVVYMDVIAAAAWSGDDAWGADIAHRGLAIVQQHGFETYYGGGIASNGAECLWSLGRLDEAAAILRQVGSTTVGGYSETGHRMARALVSMSRGDLDGAGIDLDACEDWLDAGDRTMGRYVRVVRAEWLVESGRPAEVAGIVRDAMALPPGHAPWEDHHAWLAWSWLRAAADQAEVARAKRDRAAERRAHDEATAALRALDGLFRSERSEQAPDRGRARAYAALAAAEHTRLVGRSEADAWCLAQAAWEGHGHILRPLYARVREAQVLLEHGPGGRVASTSVLREAHQRALALGATLLVTMIEGLARRGRIELETAGSRLAAASASPSASTGAPASQDRRPYGLTDRELEILGLLASGLTNRQIGERLFISPKTAGVHVSNILGKLDVGSRIQAATMAHHLGLEAQEITVGR